MVVHTVRKAVNDVSSEPDPGSLTVLANVVPGTGRGADNMSTYIGVRRRPKHT